MTQLQHLNGHSTQFRIPVQYAPSGSSYKEAYTWGEKQIRFILSIKPDLDTKELSEVIMETNTSLGNKVWNSIDLTEALDKAETPKEIELLIDSALKLMNEELTPTFLD